MALTTSLMLVMAWSSMRWRVITVTACGVSRRVSGSLVAVFIEPVVYDSLPSVVAPSCWPETWVAPSSMVAGGSASAAMAALEVANAIVIAIRLGVKTLPPRCCTDMKVGLPKCLPWRIVNLLIIIRISLTD